jgi:hypothetical protein
MNYTTFKEVRPNDIFGHLTIISQGESHVQSGGQKKKTYICKCVCGKEIITQRHRLVSGHTKSCGCVKGDCGRKISHGHWRGNKPTPEWLAWTSMKRRCYNKNHKDYKYWGAMGVIVCDRWLESFENFYKDMGDRPSEKHSIDRINPFGNYEPTNCRWATTTEQSLNKRKNYANNNF